MTVQIVEWFCVTNGHWLPDCFVCVIKLFVLLLDMDCCCLVVRVSDILETCAGGLDFGVL